MKKVALVLGITYAAAVVLAVECVRLEKQLTLKTVECEMLKVICEGYSSICKKRIEEAKEEA